MARRKHYNKNGRYNGYSDDANDDVLGSLLGWGVVIVVIAACPIIAVTLGILALFDED